MHNGVNWYYGGIIVRGSKVAIEDFIKYVQAEFGLVIIRRYISPIFLIVKEADK